MIYIFNLMMDDPMDGKTSIHPVSLTQWSPKISLGSTPTGKIFIGVHPNEIEIDIFIEVHPNETKFESFIGVHPDHLVIAKFSLGCTPTKQNFHWGLILHGSNKYVILFFQMGFQI